MKRRVLTVVLVAIIALGGLANAGADDERPTQIPLDQIWANFMPGTRDIHTLEPEVFGANATTIPDRKSYLDQITGTIQKGGEQPESAFAVSGSGRNALQSAAATLVNDKRPPLSFAPNEEVSIVFFSRPAGSRVELVDVEREAEHITVSYRFNADGLTAMTSHIALIPLGPLPAGNYDVKFVQLPMRAQEQGVGGKRMDDWERQLICRPFSFTVEGPVAK